MVNKSSRGMTAWKLILQLHQSMVKTDRCILNSVIVWIRVDQGRLCRHSANGCCRLLGRITIGKLQRSSDLGSLAMVGFREETATFQLPFLLGLQQQTIHRPDDGGVIKDHADHDGAAFAE
jgi:hypothetical protein